jgi:hypothetical protein
MTPLTNAAWVLDELISKPDVSVEGIRGGRVKCVHADIEDNCIEHGINGQLLHNDIVRIVSRYDPDEIEARAHGKFMHISGRIFKTFDRNIHVAKQDIVPPVLAHGGQPVGWYMAVDPAIGKPLAIVWAFVDASGVVRIYDEWPEQSFHGMKDNGWGVAQYAEMFKQREGGRDFTRILDRHFSGRSLGGASLKDEFAEQGITFQDSYHVPDVSGEIETGILGIKDYLRYNQDKPVDALNRPRLEISPKCINTITSMERWSRDSKTGKPREEYKDHADCVRYLLAANPCVSIPDPNWGNNDEMPNFGVRS